MVLEVPTVNWEVGLRWCHVHVEGSSESGGKWLQVITFTCVSAVQTEMKLHNVLRTGMKIPLVMQCLGVWTECLGFGCLGVCFSVWVCGLRLYRAGESHWKPPWGFLSGTAAQGIAACHCSVFALQPGTVLEGHQEMLPETPCKSITDYCGTCVCHSFSHCRWKGRRHFCVGLCFNLL